MKLIVPQGALALDPTKLKRKQLADDLKNGKPLKLGETGNVTGQEQTKLVTQDGKLALDPTKLKRKQLAEDLKNGKPLKLGETGNVTGQEQTKLVTQDGKLALDPTKLKRKQLAEDLKNGKPLKLGETGNVTGQEQTKLVTQDGKLAAQWYENDPSLLREEKEAMAHFFPYFRLYKYDDPSSQWHGCLYWRGILRPGVYDNTSWDVMAIYHRNHPNARMGGSVAVYLIDPSIEDVRDALELPGGQYPHHLINDGEGGKYLCTTRATDMSNGYSVGSAVTSAAQTLSWAVKWLTAFELVCTGDLDFNLFNRPDGI